MSCERTCPIRPKPFVADIIEIEFTPEKIVINPTPYPGGIAPAVKAPPERFAAFVARLTQEALLTPTEAFTSPLTTPTPAPVAP